MPFPELAKAIGPRRVIELIPEIPDKPVSRQVLPESVDTMIFEL